MTVVLKQNADIFGGDLMFVSELVNDELLFLWMHRVGKVVHTIAKIKSKDVKFKLKINWLLVWIGDNSMLIKNKHN